MLEYAWSVAQPWLAIAVVLAVSGGAVWWGLKGQDRLKQPWGVVPREALPPVEEIECDGCSRRSVECLSCDYLVCNTRDEAQRRAGLPRMNPAAADSLEAGCAVEGGVPHRTGIAYGSIPVGEKPLLMGVDLGGRDRAAAYVRLGTAQKGTFSDDFGNVWRRRPPT